MIKNFVTPAVSFAQAIAYRFSRNLADRMENEKGHNLYGLGVPAGGGSGSQVHRDQDMLMPFFVNH